MSSEVAQTTSHVDEPIMPRQYIEPPVTTTQPPGAGMQLENSASFWARSASPLSHLEANVKEGPTASERYEERASQAVSASSSLKLKLDETVAPTATFVTEAAARESEVEKRSASSSSSPVQSALKASESGIKGRHHTETQYREAAAHHYAAESSSHLIDPDEPAAGVERPSKRTKSDIAPWMTPRRKHAIRRSVEVAAASSSPTKPPALEPAATSPNSGRESSTSELDGRRGRR